MPHFIVEYSANLKPALALEPLFEQVHAHLIGLRLFPTGGIRSRARCVDEYRYADGAGDYAGIHIELKLSAARDPELRQHIGEQVFALVREYCAPLRQQVPYLALSMEVSLLHPEVFFNDNNLHEIFGLVP
jgi:5-carboxymethyl-2-hydroxymuconate isomerase